MGDRPMAKKDKNQLILSVPEDSPSDGDLYSDYYDCPVCSTPFNDDTWEMTSHGGDAWGGRAVYECPNNCNGVITVNY